MTPKLGGYRPDRSNPCFHVKKYKEKKREHFLSPEELARLGDALNAESPFAPSAVAAFRLLIYTGARLSEIQTLKWDDVHGNKLYLPDSKTGAKTIPLNQPALDTLARELIEARADAGLSQDDVAQRMGTSQPAVARLESGHKPSMKTLERYAEAIGKKVEIHLVAG